MFGVGAGVLGLGALGVAIAAVEHLSQPKKPSPGAPATGVPPPPPPGSSQASAIPDVPLPPLPTLPSEGPPTEDSPALAADSGEATLLIRAMIAASNADDEVDDEERSRILAALEESGLAADERTFLLAELESPLDLAALTLQVSTEEMAREVYLASLMAIEVDSPAEIRYLARLAERMGLDDDEVA